MQPEFHHIVGGMEGEDGPYSNVTFQLVPPSVDPAEISYLNGCLNPDNCLSLEGVAPTGNGWLPDDMSSPKTYEEMVLWLTTYRPAAMSSLGFTEGASFTVESSRNGEDGPATFVARLEDEYDSLFGDIYPTLEELLDAGEWSLRERLIYFEVISSNTWVYPVGSKIKEINSSLYNSGTGELVAEVALFPPRIRWDIYYD